MAEILNLKHAKKLRERAAKEKQAEANRAKFGTAKPERELAKARQEKERRDLDGRKKD
jgi:hypothetical protein